MRIANFNLEKQKNGREVWKRRAILSLALDLPDDVVLAAVRKAEEHGGNVDKLLARTRTATGARFNLYSIPEQQCLRDYRFKRKEVGLLAEK